MLYLRPSIRRQYGCKTSCFTALSGYTKRGRSWRFFIFLALNYSSTGSPTGEKQQLLELRREYILTTLDHLGLTISQMKRLLAWYRENHARRLWHSLELAKHVTEEARQQIHIEMQVNDMDPDFSYERLLFPERSRSRAACAQPDR